MSQSYIERRVMHMNTIIDSVKDLDRVAMDVPYDKFTHAEWEQIADVRNLLKSKIPE